MKALIPVAGIGSRLKPLTYTRPKALIPVAGTPILSYIIDDLIEVGCRDFVFIIGDFGDKIKNYVNDKYPQIEAQFVLQSSRQGIGHAVWTAREYIENGEELLILLGDTIVEADIEAMLEETHSTLGVKKVDDPTHFGIAEIDQEGYIQQVDEKPKIPTSNMALVGLYRIKETAALFEALEHLIEKNIHTLNEYQLTDAIQLMIDQGIKFKSFAIENWFDCGKKDVLLHTNRIMLKKAGKPTSSIPVFENSIVIDPVSIADNCDINNSIIGPNVSIGENTQINHSVIEESIIGTRSTIRSTVLHDSVIGSETYIKGLSQSLNIGDSTEIDFS